MLAFLDSILSPTTQSVNAVLEQIQHNYNHELRSMHIYLFIVIGWLIATNCVVWIMEKHIKRLESLLSKHPDGREQQQAQAHDTQTAQSLR